MLLNELNSVLEANKWAKDVKVKKGKMHKLLNIPDDKKVTDVYTSGEKLAKALMKKVKNEKKVTSMLAFAANVDKKDNVLDRALSYMKKINENYKVNEQESESFIVINASKEAVEDKYDEGEVGNASSYNVNFKGIQFSSFDELIDKTGLPSDKENWNIYDDGIIECDTLENGNSDELSKSEIRKWKNGNMKAYSVIYSLSIAKKIIPSVNDISNTLGIQKN